MSLLLDLRQACFAVTSYCEDLIDLIKCLCSKGDHCLCWLFLKVTRKVMSFNLPDNKNSGFLLVQNNPQFYPLNWRKYQTWDWRTLHILRATISAISFLLGHSGCLLLNSTQNLAHYLPNAAFKSNFWEPPILWLQVESLPSDVCVRSEVTWENKWQMLKQNFFTSGLSQL